MERSVKTSLIGFLVAAFFSVIFFFESGVMIVSYPLFSFIVLTVLIVMIIQDKTNAQKLIPVLVLTVLRCLSNPLSYTFFMSESSYESLTKGLYFDILGVFELLAVFGVLGFTLRWNDLHQKILFISLSILFIGLQAFPNTLLPSLFMGVFLAGLMVLKIEHPSRPALALIAVFDVLTSYEIYY
jgi:hypothetical protein